MGKIVQVKVDFTGVALPPYNLYFNAGQTTTLTDAEYAALPVATTRALTITQSGVADPVRVPQVMPGVSAGLDTTNHVPLAQIPDLSSLYALSAANTATPAGILGTTMIPIASNSQLNPGPTFLTGGGTFSRIKVQAIQDSVSGRFVLWNGLNIGTQIPAEVANSNPIKVRCSLEVGNGQIAPYRYAPTTGAYSAGTTYVVGSRVSSGGIYYVSLQAANLGNTPASSPTWWAVIQNTGAMYNAATAYTPGALVGLSTGAAYYLCIANTTGNAPPNASFWTVVSSSTTAYDATITYNLNDQITSGGLSYVSLVGSNLGNTPSTSPTQWQLVQYYPVTFAGQDTNRDVTLAGNELVVSEPFGIAQGIVAGGFYYINTMTQPTARTDAVTNSNGSATVTDAAIAAGDQGRALATGGGVPPYTYVGTVTPATSFLMSSSPYTQINVLSTAAISSVQILGVPNQGTYPRGNAITWAAGEFEQHASVGTAPEDYTLAGPTTRVSNSDATTSYCPVAFIGQPKTSVAGRKVIGIAGDSIALGAGDDTLISGEAYGWTMRLLTDNPTSPTKFNYTYLRMARGSSTGYNQTGPGVSAMVALASGCTHIIDEWVVNDLGAGSVSLAQLQAAALARWTMWSKLGLKVIANTSTPNTTSTDSWATVANQTPISGFGSASKWSQYNAWVLGLPAPLYAVIDAAAVVVNTASGGSNAVGTVWQPGMISLVAGSPHPSTAGHIAIATTSSVRFATAPTIALPISATTLFGAAG